MDSAFTASSSAVGEAPTSGEHRMGTTIVGVCYNGGVILGADSRTSTGTIRFLLDLHVLWDVLALPWVDSAWGTGNSVADLGMYVANRASDKITSLTDNVYVCRSGSAADTQVISDYVRYFLHQHTIQLGQPATVKVAANLIRLLAYQNKNMLQAGMIVGGWDKYEGGQIFSVPLGGTILKQSFAIGGSGSSYLYALLDHEWRDGMSQEEAEKFVVKAVSLAMARDGASGGVVRTVTINADGVTKNFYPGNKLPLWHEELEPHNSLLDILAGGSPDPMVQ
ncbi:hypothetical protein PR202_gb22658 [Eleusine coracana subsp. coracana]|uniref:Proteasome endopeptidase complex n=1 Tax=Eleusine coracana subsp. coracana TaxID=191504 RepID=A0AAV5FGB2_ELECO|nr:hypothetical protein PR202_gb22658 [Eleusine coracana subsp. coracana]